MHNEVDDDEYNLLDEPSHLENNPLNIQAIMCMCVGYTTCFSFYCFE